MSKDIEPIRQDIALPRKHLVERLRFLPSDTLAEHLLGFNENADTELALQSLFLYSDHKQAVPSKRLPIGDSDENEPAYDHGFHRIIDTHGDRTMRLRPKVYFKRGQNNPEDLHIQLSIAPHEILMPALRRNHYVDDDGGIPAHVVIAQNQLGDRESVVDAHKALRRLVLGTEALYQATNKTQFASSREASVKRVQFKSSEEYTS